MVTINNTHGPAAKQLVFDGSASDTSRRTFMPYVNIKITKEGATAEEKGKLIAGEQVTHRRKKGM